MLENDFGCAMGHEMLRLVSLHEVINVDVLECLVQEKRCLEQGKIVLKERFGLCLE